MFRRVVFAVLALFVSGICPGSVVTSRAGWQRAVVPGATIVVRQASSNFERLIDSGRDGRFSLTPIDSGEYDVQVIAAGVAILQAQ